MNLALWIIPGLLAVVFPASGAMKLIQPKAKLVASGMAVDFTVGAVKGYLSPPENPREPRPPPQLHPRRLHGLRRLTKPASPGRKPRETPCAADVSVLYVTTRRVVWS